MDEDSTVKVVWTTSSNCGAPDVVKNSRLQLC